ncbi:aldo/keto reductase [Streptomyces globisporus]|uniref:aldo/keto reductase n=1 Tax=Streptomyces globisporus TaxID=1908 RepID=UPI0037A4970C
MEYTHLGRSALRVSRLCLGTLNLGVRTDLEESYRILDMAVDRGVNFLDTANIYGWQRHKGFTEEVLGGWFAKGSGRREKVVLGTKVGNEMSDAANESGLSMRHIIASCDASLRRLGTEWIDLFQMHRVDWHAPWEEVWQAMDLLVQQGKVRYVGTSNFPGWHIAEAQEHANRRHSLGIVSEQSVYNIVTRHIESEVIPACQRYGVGVVTWSPLHGGLLGGLLRKMEEGTAGKSAQGRAQDFLRTDRQAIVAFESLCKRLAVEPAELGLAWVLSRPGVTASVVGPRSAEQLEGAFRALQLEPTEEMFHALDEIFPPAAKGVLGTEAWA